MQTFASVNSTVPPLSRAYCWKRLRIVYLTGSGLRSTTAQRAVSFARWFALDPVEEDAAEAEQPDDDQHEDRHDERELGHRHAVLAPEVSSSSHR